MFRFNPELHNFIFDTLGARFCRQPEAVQNNLVNDTDTNLNYLGTYFPRSFTESYVIHRNIFDSFIPWGYRFADTINILDIGSGTGGQLFALLQVLSERISNRTINVFSVDGNQNALDIQKRIFMQDNGKLYRHSNNVIRLYQINKVFDSGAALYEFITKQFGNIDIMLSFKFLSELYIKSNDSYHAIWKAAEKVLAPNGMLTLVDVTCRMQYPHGNASNYMSVILNQEIIQYLNEKRNPDDLLFYAIPSCCAGHCCSCQGKECFTSLTIPVQYGPQNHLALVNSKINYKLFLHKTGDLVDSLWRNGTYLVNRNACEQCIAFKNYGQCFCDDQSTYRMVNPLKDRSFEGSPFYIKIQG